LGLIKACSVKGAGFLFYVSWKIEIVVIFAVWEKIIAARSSMKEIYLKNSFQFAGQKLRLYNQIQDAKLN